MIEKVSYFIIVLVTRLFFIRSVNGSKHIPKEGPFIIVANHASYFDHFLLLTILQTIKGKKVHFLTKREAFDSFISRKWHLAMGAIPLNRQATDTSAYKSVIQHLKTGKIICIYPEGTRSPTGKMYTGKHGAIRMAMIANVPILPIGIESAFDILPKKRRLPNRHRTTINIGKPIEIKSSKDKTSLKNQHQQLMKILGDLSKNGTYPLIDIPEEEEALEKEMTDSATQWNERGIRSYPDDHLSATILHKRAIYICKQVLKRKPSNHLAHYEMARGYGRIAINGSNPIKKLVHLFRAKKALLTSIKANDSYPGSFYALAVWYLEAPRLLGGSQKKALSYYRMASSLTSEEIFIELGLAKCLLASGHSDQAKRVLLRILEDLPAKHRVDERRKVEALSLIMRLDSKFQLEDGMMEKCLLNSQIG